MADRIGVDELAELLQQTGHRHHQAYISTDGVDPEWPGWYAADLQARLWDQMGSLPTRSELTHALVAVDRAHAAAGGTESWPPFYARFLLEHFTD